MASNRTKKSSKIRSTGDTSGKTPVRKAQAARCGFCNLGYEVERTCDTLYVADDVAAHFLCMLYSSGLVQEDSDSSQFEDFGMFDPEDVKKEIKRGLALSCSVCHKKGATIGCDKEKCTKTCHYKCGMDYDYVFEENPDEGQFLMYCPKHKDLTSDMDDDDENWKSSDEEERDEEPDDENTDPSWDASPSKRTTPKRASQRKRGRPFKKGRKDEESPRRSKRARTTVKYDETDEESFTDDDMIIPAVRRVPTKKKIKEEKAQEEGEQDADKETSEQEDGPGDEEEEKEEGSGDKRMEKSRKRAGKAKEKDQGDDGEDSSGDGDDESGDEKMEKKDDGAQKTDFWDHSREAGTLGAVCTRVKQVMQSTLKKIQDDTATETECAAVTSFMKSTGLMQQLQEEEQKDKKDSGKKRNGQTKEEEEPEETKEDRDVPPKKASRFHTPRRGMKK
ncbi:uncharacterized protein DDB_G0286299-like [Branchiostoma lanceolatum]|uniref:uncharacterized protein DDB_G0286299-like n=1 Tax=Branchiostoma lanceolatum TaxID=7740 RepID=UPI00345578C2